MGKFLKTFTPAELARLDQARPTKSGFSVKRKKSFIPEGGGGAANTWAKIKTGSGQNYTADIYNSPVTQLPANLIAADAAVMAPQAFYGNLAIDGSVILTVKQDIDELWFIEPPVYRG